jgi:RNA polymerase sigma-70 factor (ECF subfamily)
MDLPVESSLSRPREFARLYAEQFRFVWSLTARLGVPSAQREDVAQEVWLAVHRRLHTLRVDASPRGWVAAITRKIASRHHRTLHRAERKIAALAEVVDEGRGADGERDSFAIVDDALARMDPAQREVFLLAHVEELTGPEIAVAVDAPLNTVYSRLRLARARLCEFLAQVEAEEREIVEAIRRRDAPPRDASARVWIAIAGGLGETAVPAAAITIGTKLAIVSATAVTTVLLVVGIGAAATDPEPAATPVVTAASAPTVPEPVRAPVTAMTALDEPRAAPVASAVPVQRPVAARSPAPAPAPAPVDTLAEETRVIGEARRALAKGDAREALALLDDHATKFPKGRMTVDARALRVGSLCAIGRTDDARAAAKALADEYPSSPSAVGVRDACATQ